MRKPLPHPTCLRYSCNASIVPPICCYLWANITGSTSTLGLSVKKEKADTYASDEISCGDAIDEASVSRNEGSESSSTNYPKQ